MGGIKINSMLNNRTDVSDDLVSSSLSHLVTTGNNIGAAHIHIEPREKYIIVRYRVGNELVLGSKLPVNVYPKILSHLKQKSGLDINESNRVQEGKILLDNNSDHAIGLNISPVIGGEKIILSLSSVNHNIASLKNLGYWGDNLYLLNKCSQAERGLILISSNDKLGNLLTLKTIANNLYFRGLSVASLGSDIEASLPKSIQIKTIDGNSNNRIADENKMKMLLRKNPDIVFISNPGGSKILSSILVQSNKRLICVGMVSDGALGILNKLLKISNYHELKNLSVITSQKTLKKLCINCRESFTPTKLEIEKLTQYFNFLSIEKLNDLEKMAIEDSIGSDLHELSSSKETINRLYRSNIHGCEDCQYTGYIGKVNITEVIESDRDDLGKLMTIEKNTLNEIRNYLNKQGNISMELDGLLKCLRGMTDFRDINNLMKVNRV